MNFPKVINYHSIIAPRKGSSWNYDSIYSSDFAKQLKLMSRHFNFLHPNEVLLRIQSGQKFAFRDILLTFDDGYQNNLDFAAPILKSLGITALIFLNTKNLGGNDLLWFNWIKLLKQRGLIKKDPLGIEKMSLPELYEYINQFKVNNISLSNKEKEQFLGADRHSLLKLVDEDVFIPGGHTSDHPKLNIESHESIVDQIEQNRKYLSNVFQKEIDFFAYPQGLVNDKIIKVVKESGYKVAFVVSKYLKHQDISPHTIPRIGVYRGSRSYLLAKLFLNLNR